MFPEREIKQDRQYEPLTVYRGYKFTIGIRIVVDKVWLYRLQDGETLTVDIRDDKNDVKISKSFTKADIDGKDAVIIVNYDEAETESLTLEQYYISASVDGYVIFKPKKIKVKEIAS